MIVFFYKGKRRLAMYMSRANNHYAIAMDITITTARLIQV